MGQAVVAAVDHRDAGVAQPLGVAFALVDQRVESGGGHDRRRQARQVFRPDRRQARVRRIGVRTHVVGHEPVHGVARQRIGVGEGGHRLGFAGHVDGGIDQQLQSRLRLAGALHLLGDNGGEVAAHGVAADRRQALGRAEAGGVVATPAVGGQHVFQPAREPRLRRQAVVDRQHRAAGDAGQDLAEDVAGLQVADHPAAEVGEDHQGRGRVLLGRAISAQLQRPAGAVDGKILDPHAGLGLAGHRRQPAGAGRPGLLRRQGRHGRHPPGAGGQELEAGVQGASALIDHAAAGHRPQDGRRQRQQDLQDRLLDRGIGHGALRVRSKGAAGRECRP